MNAQTPLHYLRLESEAEAKAAVIKLYREGKLEDWLAGRGQA